MDFADARVCCTAQIHWISRGGRGGKFSLVMSVS